MEVQNLDPVKRVPTIENLAVMLTYKCQMACRYCFLDRSCPDMSEDVLYRSIDLLLSSPSEEVELQFFGGEPLLRFDLIKKAITYVQKKGPAANKKMRYLITTNGLLLDEDKLDYLSGYRVALMLSLDGARETQTRNRPLANKNGNNPYPYDLLLRNLDNIVRRNLEYFVNMVFLPEDIRGLEENIHRLVDSGARDIQLSYMIGGDYSDEDMTLYLGLLDRIIKFTATIKVNFRNLCNDNEPVLSSPQITVGSNQDVYLGCSFILAKLYPQINRLFYFGRLQDIGDIRLLKRSRQEQLGILMKNKKALPARIMNNIRFGIKLYAFFKNRDLYFRGRKPYPLGQGWTKNYLYHNKLLLMLTYKCQMACRYCFLDRSCPDMSEDVLYRSIDLLLSSPSEEVELQFFGGEPLLRFDLIKKAITYVQKKGPAANKKMRYLITTNGLLLDEDKLDYLSGYRVAFLISLDGKMTTQRVNRPIASGRKKIYPFRLLVRNLRLLVKNDFDFFVNIVVGKDNIGDLARNTAFFLENGVKRIRFSYEIGESWGRENIMEYFCAVFETMAQIGGKSGIEVINTKADDEPSLASPVLTVDYDGKIYCNCTIPLDKVFSRFRRNNLVGDISSSKEIGRIQRSKAGAVNSLLGLYPPGSSQARIILNNLVLGWLSGDFFGRFFAGGRYADYLKKKEEPSVNSLMVMCTHNCQFICDYCNVKQLNISMPLETLHKSLDLLLTTRSRQCQLRFWGGEPLLEWNLIGRGMEEGLRRARRKGKEIKFMITTNGLLLDKEKLEYLKAYPVEIMFSLDGDPETNGIHRIARVKGRHHDDLLANLRVLIESGVSYFINMVTTPSTVNKLSENLAFLKAFGVNKVQLGYQNGVIWPRKKTEVLFDELGTFFRKNVPDGFLMNFFNDCEPTMLSQEIIVDTDGRVYLDAAIFMEKVFPRLKSAYLLGEVDKIKNIDSLYRPRRDLYHLFGKSCSGQKKRVFVNNVDLGLRVDSFLRDLHNQSSASNEHPLLIPIIKGGFSAQQKILGRLGIESLFLYLDGPCVNDCLFCKHKDGPFSDIFKVEEKLKGNVKTRGRKLCIIGNDPLLHPEIAGIAEISTKHGFTTVEIMTSGEPLSDMHMARGLIDRGVSSFSLPIFSADGANHDYIAGRKGSFSRVMQGINNAVALGARVFIHTNLIKQNINDIMSLERFVRRELGLPFIILPIRPKTANLAFGKLMPSYSEIIEKLKGTDALLGFPLCVARQVQEEVFKDKEEISDSMKLYILDQRFLKLKVCAGCSYKDKCLGLFKEYFSIYGMREIAPIKK